jgi:fatty acid desaturase
MDEVMRPRFLDLSLHLVRIAFWSAALALAAHYGVMLGIAFAAVGAFLAAFALMHDAAHGALRLPRPVNELLLSAAGAMMLMSGHALRLLHLAHHAHPLAADDYEGRPATTPLWRALVAGPIITLGYRVRAFERARAKGRRWQLLETAVNVGTLALLLGSRHPALVGYALVALAMQATMATWAAYIPHNAPAWLTAAARPFGRLGSATALSLAYHELHHARPAIPCARLASEAARS